MLSTPYFLPFLSVSLSLYNMQPEDRGTVLYNYYVFFYRNYNLIFLPAYNISTFTYLCTCVLIFNFFTFNTTYEFIKMLPRYKKQEKKKIIRLTFLIPLR